MYSDSRKAQHNSFAHHRAELLFSNPTLTDPPRRPLSLAFPKVEAPDGAQSLQQRISAGIHGFVPAGATR